MTHRLSHILIGLLIIAVVGSPARADDIKLKSGKVYKNLTFIKEQKGTLYFKDEKGRTIRITKKAIETWTKLPTTLGTFLEKERATDTKDTEAMLALGTWAKEQGLSKEANRIFKAVLRRDPKNVAAREGMGDHLVDGKWISAKDWAKQKAKEAEKLNKARGYKRHKTAGWLDPVSYARVDQGLVEHEGHWVSPAQLKDIEKEGLVWCFGEWVNPEDKARMEKGERKKGKKWLSEYDANFEHGDPKNPWRLESEGVVVITNCNHKSAVQFLKIADEAYAMLKNTFGLEPPGLHDKDGKLQVFVGRELKEYQEAGGRNIGSDREAFKSSNGGAFYGSRPAPGGVRTYREANPDWTRFWIAQGVAHAWVARFREYPNTPEPAMEALGGYISTAHKGKYEPNWWHYCQWLNSSKNPLPTDESILNCALTREYSFCQTGLSLHYLEQQNSKAFKDWWVGFLYKEHDGSLKKLSSIIGDSPEPTFETWLADYKAKFRPWDK